MGYYTDISQSEHYSAKHTALQNRMKRVSNHTILGSLLASNATGIFGTITQLATTKKSQQDESMSQEVQEKENNTFQETRSLHAAFLQAAEQFKKAPSKETAQKLAELAEKLKPNPSSKCLYDYYVDNFVKKHPQYFNSKQ